MSIFTGGLLSGDIWSTGAFSFESPLKDLLDKGDFTLQELLAEDELLQELRGVHPKLIEFLSTETSVTQLVHYVVDPKPISLGMGGRTAAAAVDDDKLDNSASDSVVVVAAAAVTPKDPSTWLQEKGNKDDPEMLYIRYPFMACEIFCCEIDGIINLLVDGSVKHDIAGDNGSTEKSPTRLLDLLFSVLTDTPVGSLDDYRAGYLEKLLRVLFKKRAISMTAYLRDNKERLIPALLQHLYCHSIMQIAQRLLLPHKPTPKKAVAKQANDETSPSASDSEEQLLTPAEDGDDETPEANPEIKCEWSTSEQAIDILLDSLIGTLPQSDGSDIDGATSAADNDDEPAPFENEQQLDLSLNASEVLITIVQNSMLSSPQMLRLTSTPVLERLILAATTCRPDPQEFSCHESLLTSAMSVLESLILQLGGYGAVGTMSLVEEATTEQEEKKGDPETATLEDAVNGDSHTAAIGENSHLISDLSNLIDLLPILLERLSDLLTHPSCADWKSPTQFHKEPQLKLGSSRLRIVRVLEALVLLGDPDVDQHLVQSDCLEICLDFFWEFQWCSMLHQSVANLLVHVFEGGNARVDMQEYFLIRCNILVRLMDSFQETAHDLQRLDESPNVHVNMGNVAAVDNESGDNDVLAISEDDVDAAIEKEEDKDDEKGVEQSQLPAEDVSHLSTEAVQFESRAGSSVGLGPAQSFRFGYMGHVIIICQALVHACAQTYFEDDDQTGQSEDGTRSVRSTDRLAGIKRSTSSVISRNTNDSVSVSRADEESVEKEPLFLAEMVRYHPLSDRWDEFVNTTLASETAIQSTPLGGYNTTANDLRRPGLADDGDAMGYDGQPALPSRRLGELDMDDNDLDIAASMMAALDMGRGGNSDDEDDFSGSGDSNRSYNSGETNNSGGYLFDDPLGKDTTGLGIELGKLTKFKSELQRTLAENQVTSAAGGDDASSSSSSRESSSDEEDVPGGEDDAGAPVMDLFAGNFNYDQPNEPVATDFDFANFDDAFAGEGDADTDDEFGAFVAASPQTAGESDLDKIFEAHDSAPLLEFDCEEERKDDEDTLPVASDGPPEGPSSENSDMDCSSSTTRLSPTPVDDLALDADQSSLQDTQAGAEETFKAEPASPTNPVQS